MAVLGKTPRWARLALFMAVVLVMVGIPSLYLGSQGVPAGSRSAALDSPPTPTPTLTAGPTGTPTAPREETADPAENEDEATSTPSPRPTPSSSQRVRKVVAPSTTPVAVKRQISATPTPKKTTKTIPGLYRCGTPSYVSAYPNYFGSAKVSQLCAFTKMAVGSIYKRVDQVGFKRYGAPPITLVTTWKAYYKLNCKPQWKLPLDLAPIFWCGKKYGYVLFHPALKAIYDGHGGTRIGSYSTLAVVSVNVAALHMGQSSSARAACVSGWLLDGWHMFNSDQAAGYLQFLKDHAQASPTSLERGFHYGLSGRNCSNL